MLRKRLVRQSLARLFFPLLLVLSLSPCVAHAAPGDLDPSFGIGGKVITDGGVASAVAVQADGKIVAAGIFDSGEIGLVRYNTDGSVDASFGTGGRVATGILDSTDEPVLVIQPDGKAVVAGTTPNPISRRGDFVLARYNPDSTPDQGFGTGGKVITNFAFDNFGLDSDEGAHALALQADGKLVAAGVTRFINRDPNFAVARYNLAV